MPRSFWRGHVPEAINLHTDELNDYEGGLRAEAQPYLVVIAARGRGGAAVRRLLL